MTPTPDPDYIPPHRFKPAGVLGDNLCAECGAEPDAPFHIEDEPVRDMTAEERGRGALPCCCSAEFTKRGLHTGLCPQQNLKAVVQAILEAEKAAIERCAKVVERQYNLVPNGADLVMLLRALADTEKGEG